MNLRRLIATAVIAGATLPCQPAGLRTRRRSSTTSTTCRSQALKGLRNIRNHLDVDPRRRSPW
jgi:hypothetical protein